MPVTINENGDPIFTPGLSDAHDILVCVRNGRAALQARVDALKLKEHHLSLELYVARKLRSERTGFADDVGRLMRLRRDFEAALASFAALDEAGASEAARHAAGLVYAVLALIMQHEGEMRDAALRCDVGVVVAFPAGISRRTRPGRREVP